MYEHYPFFAKINNIPINKLGASESMMIPVNRIYENPQSITDPTIERKAVPS